MRCKPGIELPLRPNYVKPRLACVCCGKVGPIVGRGLRGKCYQRELAAGTLANWPKLPRNGKREKTETGGTTGTHEKTTAGAAFDKALFIRLHERVTKALDDASVNLGRLGTAILIADIYEEAANG